MPTRYDSLPETPEQLGAGTVLARLTDGLAFRYRWASHDLRADDLAFSPGSGAMTTEELLDHLRVLARWMSLNVGAAREGAEPVPYVEASDGLSDPGGDAGAYVSQTLDALAALRDHLAAMSDDDLGRVVLVGGREPTPFPVWNMLNGPLADALTHVGQLNSWRRLMGREIPRPDVFRGRPPKGYGAG